MQVPIVYKQVAVRDGKYWSCFVGAPGCHYSVSQDYNALEYTVGLVTISPDAAGIFCKATKEQAITDAKIRRDMWEGAGLAAVLECYPIGRQSERITSCNYPAVYIIREIWREKPKKT